MTCVTWERRTEAEIIEWKENWQNIVRRYIIFFFTILEMHVDVNQSQEQNLKSQSCTHLRKMNGKKGGTQIASYFFFTFFPPTFLTAAILLLFFIIFLKMVRGKVRWKFLECITMKVLWDVNRLQIDNMEVMLRRNGEK